MATYRVWIHLEKENKDDFEEVGEPVCLGMFEDEEEAERLKNAVIEMFG